MKSIVVGYGVQGRKRQLAAGPDFVATVDPNKPEANYRDIREVPLDSYDAALVCTPEIAKLDVLEYLLKNKKHVLVEKPLLGESISHLMQLKTLAEEKNVVCYTAYNHRFEPTIQQIKAHLESGSLGKVYVAKLFYGNGTARDVRNSVWRDHGDGVLHDLGSHLLNLVALFFPDLDFDFIPKSYKCFENKAFDYFSFSAENGSTVVDIETTLLSWKNSFKIDMIGENGSLHLDGLCKWGASTLAFHQRILPSGKPLIRRFSYERPDETWHAEYEYFKEQCKHPVNSLPNDIWINEKISALSKQARNNQ